MLGRNTIRDSNAEFPWDKDFVNNSAAAEGPAISLQKIL